MSSLAIDGVFSVEKLPVHGKRCGKRNVLPCEGCADRRVRCVWIRVPNCHDSPLCQACDKRGLFGCQPRAQTCRKSRMTRKRNNRELIVHSDGPSPSQFLQPSDLHCPVQLQSVDPVPLDGTVTQADVPRQNQQNPLFGVFAQYPALHLGAVSNHTAAQRATAAMLTAPPSLARGTQAALFDIFDPPTVAENFESCASVSSQLPASRFCTPSVSSAGVLWSRVGTSHQLCSELQFDPLPLGGWVPVPCNFGSEVNASEALNFQQAFDAYERSPQQ
ncbi:hypothetical protein SCHPADRAFT_629946 [Schizopora paradoxa]|uniref:Zn(2)-C6 fungal-type domain-containing protein n=1 Tax=Schizopora paradoxa TaxID=27342 RepID=A0A0H2R8X5_9AGAM|nr:hypothetical protein SCHPADRAFT_629946 [Schizopora paradoxa]